MKIPLLPNMLALNNHLRLVCFFILTLLTISNSFSFQQNADASSTIIDLQDKRFRLNTEIKLDTCWDFYWKELIYPNTFEDYTKTATLKSLKSWVNIKDIEKQKFSSFGYATYRLKLKLPGRKPLISLYVPAIFSSSKIWVNGELKSEMGSVGKSKKKVTHKVLDQTIPLDVNSIEFDIVIQVANFYHHKGGINKPLILGATQHIQNYKRKEIVTDMLFMGCLTFIGIFFLIFYLSYWYKDKAVLYFSILSISLSYLTMSNKYGPVSYIIESISWSLLTKIEYFSLFIVGTSGSLFIKEIFPTIVYKYYAKIIVGLFFLFTILTILLPGPYFTKLIVPYDLILAVNLIYIVYVFLNSIITKRYNSIFKLITIALGLIIFVIHLYLYLTKNNSNPIIYLDLGYIVVFLILSIYLMTRFSDSFRELRQAKNIAVQQQEEILMQSNELKSINIRLEENLKQLEDSNTELDDFNHIVSHDLKSPLISIYSLVSFIEEDLKTTLNLDTKQHLELLKGIVSKMEALINGLLEYSKIAKGKKQKTAFKLDTLIDKVIGIVDYQNKSVITLLNKNFDVFASEIELNHVFQNLISNAIKHNDKEKAIIDISVTKSKNEYLFSVRDNGPGIAPEYHTKIFKIFSQLEVNEDVESTGIGLAIVKKIISENKGVITVDSELGNGTTINFTWKV